MTDGNKRLNICINSDLHRDLKIQAAVHQTTISQFVIDAITEKIKRQKEEKNSGTD